MSTFRRFLIIVKMLETVGGSELVLKFIDGIATLNSEGNENKITMIGTEVTLNA